MEIIRLSEDTFDTALSRARDVLKKGGIVLYPTDTLYGLAVDALNRPALATLRELKGREKKKPISIVLMDMTAVEKHTELHEKGRELIQRHLPGALTLVVPGRSHLPDELMLNGQVGVRIPDEDFARALAHALDGPITATSANRSGFQTLATVQEILSQFGQFSHLIDMVIDAGERAGGTPSTVVTFIDGTPYILREGAISREELGL